MKTALIITTYNRPDALQVVLLSLLQQTVLPDEILIADDGSDERTSQVIEQFSHLTSIQIHHVWHEDNGFRLAEIRNKALAKTKCEHIIFIDGDIIMHPHFIANHRHVIAPKKFIQGSRVLLSSTLTQKLIYSLPETLSSIPLFRNNNEKKLAGIYLPCLGFQLAKKATQKFKGIKGCNMGFWREDAIAINGFNQQFIGWGLEDSEFVARLYNYGIYRHNLKFAAIGYHLWHKPLSRNKIADNDILLTRTIEQKLTWCEKGVKQWLDD